MPKKKLLDKKKTLDNFEKRITDIIKQTWTENDKTLLDQSYLSTYECYSTLLNNLPNDHHNCNSAVVLMRIFRDLGANVLGVTSERTKNGEFVAENRKSMKKVVYVGKHTYFTNKNSFKWRIKPCDFEFESSGF